MGSNSVWFGDGQQGSLDITRAGCKGIAGLSLEKRNNNNTFTWSGPSGVLAAPDNGL
jgi:hypothetical protein